MKTPFAWRIALFGENCWAESVSETRAIVRQAGKEPEIVERPVDNHLGRNLDYFSVLGQGTFPIPLTADANGAWMTV